MFALVPGKALHEGFSSRDGEKCSDSECFEGTADKIAYRLNVGFEEIEDSSFESELRRRCEISSDGKV